MAKQQPPKTGKWNPQLAKMLVRVDSLEYHPRNARAHDDRNIAAIKESLAEYGQQRPIVVDQDGRVVAGNGTLQAARELGWSHIARLVFDGTDAQSLGYQLADNKTAELASWDEPVLADLLQELSELDFNLPATGFDASEIEALLNPATPAIELQEDAVQEVPEVSCVRTGDLWLCGKHRILCGDSTKPEDVTRLMNGERASLLVTDPPYNLGESWNGLQKLRGNEQVANDDHGADWFEWAATVLQTLKDHVLADDTAGYWWASQNFLPRFVIENGGFTVHATIVWVKEHFNVGRADIHSQYEPCLYFSRGKRYWCGRRDLSDVWDARRVEQIREHPTQKPLSLIGRCIECSSEKGALVFDGFMGSGTTMIAAQMLNRVCYGVEIEPKYVEVALNRYLALTGEQPELAATGQTLEQVKAERCENSQVSG